jgi:YidC/Oxa1 family membrane protein insertase
MNRTLEAVMWDGFVDLVRASIVAAAHLCGGSLGGGIVLVSAGVRLALLPLTLRLARQTRDQHRRLVAIRPELEALRSRHADDPATLWRETQALREKHGIRLVSPAGLVAAAVQVPLLGALFAAVRGGFASKVRFLWIADLARRDVVLTLAVTALTGWVVARAPTAQGQTPPAAFLVVAVVGTAIVLWTTSSAAALSIGAGSLVSALQNWLLARDTKRKTE